MTPPSCRFVPTCSEYAIEAIKNMVLSRDCIWLSAGYCVAIRGAGRAMIRFRKSVVLMLLDIHTHRNAAVPGECIFNVEPAWFEPVEGCYYSVGIHPWKVLEAGPEDWTTLEKAVCHPSVLAIGEAGLDRLGPADILLQKRCLSDKFY